MHLDPNSLFEEIGLQEELTFEKPHRLITMLQIQVAEDQICQLEVRQFDDPYVLALSFCGKHQLNEIAVDVIEQRIREIFNKEKIKEFKSFGMSSKNDSNMDPNKKPKNFKNGVEVGARLYEKGMRTIYKAEENRIKHKMQKEAEDNRQLTFKPKINEVSEKIVETRKIIGGNAHKIKAQQNLKRFNDQMEQCTFKPAINKASLKIVQERKGRNEEQTVQKLYYDSVRLASRRQNSDKIQQFAYKPTINQKSRIQVRDTFMERLEKDMKNKKEKQLRSIAEDEHCSFTPEIGRPPKIARNKENLPIGDYLISRTQQTRSKSEISHEFTSIGESAITNKNSSVIYQNLVRSRVQLLFELLDGNRDGLISPDHIDIEELSTNTLLLLQPFFKQMEQMNAVLDQRAFTKAILKLLQIAPQHLKGEFISERWKRASGKKYSFRPKLNNKSNQLAQQRSTVDLYEQGIKAKKKKEVYTAILQARKEEEQLQQCTFKPLLNSTSQVYVRKHIFKGSPGDPGDSLDRFMLSSQNQDL